MTYSAKTKPVRRGPPKAARAAAAVFSRLAKTTSYADPGLSENWPTIAGSAVAALGRPGRVIGNGPGRTLEIIVRDGAAAAELQMRTGELIQAVNRYLGPDAVSRIAIRQRAGARREPQQHPADDNDSPLASALSSFQAAVKARNPSK